MPQDTSFWPVPFSKSSDDLYLWGRRLVDLLKAAKYREVVTGSVTLTAGTTTTKTDTNMLSGSVILFTPTNAAARTLGIPAVTTKTQGTSFTLTHAAAAGTETYDYLLYR